ncbi:SH3-like domain-containing protein [Sporosarcina sp. Marseille-Q4063]|uniref:GW dipeptide domain-containing protein n=1 Tax=Sporosarcina sp. Marseille-Q4063 TaxID=2810514 RepID=UPI001BB03D21|nr:GW dipeptide domain-containing protein [Sporosarcina sp. Marseille-Q4063]QUW21221.1 SH3-like domain-containing protein [Sporosarcina sp. Marseille-Q4063]
MKKITIILITLLIFNLAFPSHLLADNSANVSEVEFEDSNYDLDSDIENESEESQEEIEGQTENLEQGTEPQTGLKEEQEIEQNVNPETDSESTIHETVTETDKETDKEKDKETDNEIEKSDDAEIKTNTENKSSLKRSVQVHNIQALKETVTSKLGRIQTINAKIYKTIGQEDTSITAGSTYTNKVFYIKKQAEANGQNYYLISTLASSTNGVIGWVKATDMWAQNHVAVDHEQKTFYLKGTGWSYTDAWGASQDVIYSNLSQYRNQEFKVNLTEKVGDAIWYRGTLSGKSMWIQAYNVKTSYETETSKLGHIQSANAKIYKNIGEDSTSINAGSTYTNKVFYIKKEVEVNGQHYYLISTVASSTNGVIGWVKATDMWAQNHVAVDHEQKTFYLKGTGWSYTDAWGASQNVIYNNLSSYINQEFKVNLTEKVGDAIWYRGILNGRTMWIQAYNVQVPKETETSKLGHIQSTNAKIYNTIGEDSTSVTAGSTYTNKVFYIKKQAEVNGQHYYLISTVASSTNGVIGWVKATDMWAQNHVAVDHEQKTFYLKGTGWSYTDAWGAFQNVIYNNLSTYRNQEFKVNLTEKVGDAIWYRGILNGKSMWIQAYNVQSTVETETSKLGHIQSENAKIYKNVGEDSTSITAGSTYTNKVFYIKKQAELNGVTYYLISTLASSTNGVIGWVKATDMWAQDHVAVNHEQKTFYLKGTGWSYTDAWGASQNVIYNNLYQYSNQEFKVNLTEKVGDAIWYRGTLNGKSMWIQAYNVKISKESITSKLGHIQSADAKIYNSLDEDSSITAGSTYMNKVFYIKKQAKANGQNYYLISTVASSTNGVIGWVKAEDMWAQNHVAVDHEQKTFYLKGTGWSYTDAWGASQNVIYNDLTPYRNQEFKVNLTEKVGEAIWYRGILNGRSMWIQEFNTTRINETYSNYNLTVDRMTDIQMAVTPQTDKRYMLWIREDAFESIIDGQGVVNNNNWNLRRGPGTDYAVGEQVRGGTKLPLFSSTKGVDGYIWYHVRNTTGWVIPDRLDLAYYLKPSNFTSNLTSKLQFLKLSTSAYINVNEVNEKVLRGKGILEGKAQLFVDGGEVYGVNEIYLISHALLETGNGTSALATGIQYNGKTVYNMYGIGAKDSCPLECGAKYAYDAGWFTPELAIVGGAAFVGRNYINVGQDTLYKMRWNPFFAANNGYASHQYATDIGWASKQTYRMNEIYNLLDSYSLFFDIPVYR